MTRQDKQDIKKLIKFKEEFIKDKNLTLGQKIKRNLKIMRGEKND